MSDRSVMGSIKKSVQLLGMNAEEQEEFVQTANGYSEQEQEKILEVLLSEVERATDERKAQIQKVKTLAKQLRSAKEHEEHDAELAEAEQKLSQI